MNQNLQTKIIAGGVHKDARGTLLYNNEFDAAAVRRVYTIEHANTELVRGWLGHEIENRWFSVVKGAFEINVQMVQDWERPGIDRHLQTTYCLKESQLDILHIPPGHVFSLRALEPGSRLLVMGDHPVGSTNDERRYPFEV